MPKLGANMTAVHYSTNTNNSVRTTIPIGLADILGLKKGDRLKWGIKKDGKDICLIVKKLNGGNNGI